MNRALGVRGESSGTPQRPNAPTPSYKTAMPTFEYQAQSADGQTVTGMVVGLSLEGAARDLEGRGMQVTRLGLASSVFDPIPADFQAAGAAGRAPRAAPAETPRTPHSAPPEVDPLLQPRSYVQTSVAGPLVGKVGLSHLLFFFRQLATLLNAGVPYIQSLETLGRQATNPKLAEIVGELRTHVEAGRPISAGMQRYPEVFSPVMLSLVRAGEDGGFLDKALATVAGYLEREIELRNLYRRVTFVPKLQIAGSMIIIIGANLIISSINAKAQGLSSPLTTLSTWIWLGPLLIAIFLFLRVGLANPRIKYNWDLVISSLPGFGTVMRQLAMARFGRAFGALYAGGVPISKAIALSADACGNEYLRARMQSAPRALEGGAGVAETFVATGAFSPIVLDMVRTGETTGNLDQMLTKMSEFYEDESTTRSQQLGQTVGVVVGLCVAIYIAYIVITFYMGYYSGISSAGSEA